MNPMRVNSSSIPQNQNPNNPPNPQIPNNPSITRNTTQNPINLSNARVPIQNAYVPSNVRVVTQPNNQNPIQIANVPSNVRVVTQPNNPNPIQIANVPSNVQVPAQPNNPNPNQPIIQLRTDLYPTVAVIVNPVPSAISYPPNFNYLPQQSSRSAFVPVAAPRLYEPAVQAIIAHTVRQVYASNNLAGMNPVHSIVTIPVNCPCYGNLNCITPTTTNSNNVPSNISVLPSPGMRWSDEFYPQYPTANNNYYSPRFPWPRYTQPRGYNFEQYPHRPMESMPNDFGDYIPDDELDFDIEQMFGPSAHLDSVDARGIRSSPAEDEPLRGRYSSWESYLRNNSARPISRNISHGHHHDSFDPLPDEIIESEDYMESGGSNFDQYDPYYLGPYGPRRSSSAVTPPRTDAVDPDQVRTNSNSASNNMNAPNAMELTNNQNGSTPSTNTPTARSDPQPVPDNNNFAYAGNDNPIEILRQTFEEGDMLARARQNSQTSAGWQAWNVRRENNASSPRSGLESPSSTSVCPPSARSSPTSSSLARGDDDETVRNMDVSAINLNADEPQDLRTVNSQQDAERDSGDMDVSAIHLKVEEPQELSTGNANTHSQQNADTERHSGEAGRNIDVSAVNMDIEEPQNSASKQEASAQQIADTLRNISNQESSAQPQQSADTQRNSDAGYKRPAITIKVENGSTLTIHSPRNTEQSQQQNAEANIASGSATNSEQPQQNVDSNIASGTTKNTEPQQQKADSNIASENTQQPQQQTANANITSTNAESQQQRIELNIAFDCCECCEEPLNSPDLVVDYFRRTEARRQLVTNFRNLLIRFLNRLDNMRTGANDEARYPNLDDELINMFVSSLNAENRRLLEDMNPGANDEARYPNLDDELINMFVSSLNSENRRLLEQSTLSVERPRNEEQNSRIEDQQEVKSEEMDEIEEFVYIDEFNDMAQHEKENDAAQDLRDESEDYVYIPTEDPRNEKEEFVVPRNQESVNNLKTNAAQNLPDIIEDDVSDSEMIDVVSVAEIVPEHSSVKLESSSASANMEVEPPSVQQILPSVDDNDVTNVDLDTIEVTIGDVSLEEVIPLNSSMEDSTDRVPLNLSNNSYVTGIDLGNGTRYYETSQFLENYTTEISFQQDNGRVYQSTLHVVDDHSSMAESNVHCGALDLSCKDSSMHNWQNIACECHRQDRQESSRNTASATHGLDMLVTASEIHGQDIQDTASGAHGQDIQDTASGAHGQDSQDTAQNTSEKSPTAEPPVKKVCKNKSKFKK